MALGLPSVNIVFKQEGITAIQRGDRGIVALVLRDTKEIGKHTDKGKNATKQRLFFKTLIIFR